MTRDIIFEQVAVLSTVSAVQVMIASVFQLTAIVMQSAMSMKIVAMI